MASTSQLLALPAEIRLIIWEYALTSSTGSLVYDFDKRRFDVSTIGAGILTTCHSMASETLYLPLKLNRLVFDVHTFSNVDFMVFLARLNRLEAELGWVWRTDIRFGDRMTATGSKYFA